MRSIRPPLRHLIRDYILLVVGLTGGIASGKSSVAELLAGKGAAVIDADKLGHSAYLSGTEAFDQVVDAFGAEVVGANGEIDRRVLGSKVFDSEENLKRLTDIVWPAIRQLALKEITSIQTKNPEQLIVLEAAVLIEANWRDMVDELWVVNVPRNLAVDRAVKRDGLAPEAVQKRIDAQISNKERAQHADVAFDNSGDFDSLRTVVSREYERLYERFQEH